MMQAHAITENEAYIRLRNAAMNQGRKLGDVAEAVVHSTRPTEGKPK